MKLVLITNWWRNSDGGGIREYSINLVKHLREQGIEIKVIFREGDDSNEFKLKKSRMCAQLQTLDILRIEKPNVILCQGGWFFELPAIIYKLTNPNIKIFAIYHTPLDKSWSFYKTRYYNATLNKFDGVIYISDGLRKNYAKLGGLNIRKSHIIHPAIEYRLPDKMEIIEFRKKFQIDPEKTYLLGLGLTALKQKKEGAKLLINVLARLDDSVRLILTRDGIYRNELELFAHKQGVSNRVIFTGDINNPYVALEVCDIYTHISYGEGLPAAVLEAMLVGKPVIASSVSGIPEVVIDGYNGLLVKNEIDDVIRAYDRLISNHALCVSLSKNARETILINNLWESIIQKFLNLIAI